MNQRQFGLHSENDLMEGRLTLFDSFNEAEATADAQLPNPGFTEVVISSYRRKKSLGKREEDLEGLPARVFDHHIPDDELARLFPNSYKELPDEVYKRLHIIPETFIVNVDHVHVDASKDNNGTIGKALAFSIHQKPYLRLFLTDGDVPMDNNYAEQAIRPFTIGRKNFVLIDSSNGTHASAIIYSLVETAKAHQLNVYQYLELSLTEIPKHMDDKNLSFLDDLLPWATTVQEKCPIRFKKS